MNSSKITPVTMETVWLEDGFAYVVLLSKPNGQTLWGYQYNSRNDISIDCMADEREYFVKTNNLEIVWESDQVSLLEYCQEIIDGKHNYYAGENNLLSGNPSDAGL